MTASLTQEAFKTHFGTGLRSTQKTRTSLKATVTLTRVWESNRKAAEADRKLRQLK